ncbi:hypothetical protein BGZ97_004562 [Linnemannia gamsii]|jgi:hypothetical protein|uniref:Uncharacterized protein n=1 Tax=Linnemannia gamsii TaxID=64522 RepID=A0A9P6QVN3_9FUNG|nr:hypothetical protein BGZ97_004562 [Linnemannia gamsii]
MRLEIEGVRTKMVADRYVQKICLELSLASGQDELAGLKELEMLDVNKLTRQIGMAEVQWMVENWPMLNSIPGLVWSTRITVLRLHSKVAIVMAVLRWKRQYLNISDG